MTDQEIYVLACKDKMVRRYSFMLVHWDPDAWNRQIKHMRDTMTPKHRARALEDYSWVK